MSEHGTKTLGLFQGIGVEMEYMIVDRQTLEVRPVADELLKMVTGSYSNDYEKEHICWSNELALHVVELKTCGPVASLVPTLTHLNDDIAAINELLAGMDAMLMPGGAHPWMDPLGARLWPHGSRDIYNAYDRIFQCSGHGWVNLQSCHVNLPFDGAEEFGRLHAAIRMILPIIPALAASTPIVDQRVQDFLDYRMEVYRTNSQKIPDITGQVIPEAVFDPDSYQRDILEAMYQAIEPHDPQAILRKEWLNARGAIARFDRSAIEIRVIDTQECAVADLAVATAIMATTRALCREHWGSYQSQTGWSVEALRAVFLRTIRAGEAAVIDDTDYLAAFGIRDGKARAAGELWQHILEESEVRSAIQPQFLPSLQNIVEQGTLARRILRAVGADCSKARLATVYRSLSDCLREGRQFLP